MRKMTMPNFCINFLNKAEKSLPILYDFAVASLADAWIKILGHARVLHKVFVASLADAWIKIDYEKKGKYYIHVASLADAWIKMARKRKETGGKRLHPSRMRGSKHGARKTILYTLKKRKEEKKWMELLSERQYYIY